MATWISKYLSYYRATYSDAANKAGVKNIPGEADLKALKLLGENIYDKVCTQFGIVFASSVFRNKKVNSLVGGSETSGHVKGECIDLDGDAPSETFTKVDNNSLFKWIKNNLVYDQLIAEFEQNGSPKWIHVGYRAVGNRQQTLIATKNSAGRTVYMIYTDKLYKKIYKNARDVGFIDLGVFEMPETDHLTYLNESTDDNLLVEEFCGNRGAFTDEVNVVSQDEDNIKVELCPETEPGTHTIKIGDVVITINIAVNDNTAI